MDLFNKLKTFAAILLFMIAAGSCKKEQNPPDTIPEEIKIVNNFIYQYTTDLYLWNKYIPSGIDINDYPSPYDLFDAMYYPTLDHWSFVTDDYDGFMDNLNGIQTTEGYIIQLYKFPSNNNLFAIVEYVYEGGTAALDGIKRGNVILSINGQTINLDNYQTLFPLMVKELGLGKIENGQIVDLGTKVTVTQKEMNINPVLQYSVLDKGIKKIGYFLYDQFTENVSVLVDVVTYFKGQNITDLVLDLRYNPGGYATTLDSLAAMLAPSSTTGKTLFRQQWNEGLTDYLISEYGTQSDWFITKFPTPPVNVNLSTLYVLTSSRTASASESLINGLNPYMDVVIIGEQTSGKYTGAWFLDDQEHPENNWGLYLVTSKIANVEGTTDFINGFAPDYIIEDDFVTPLGDETEPLFAKAISLINNIPVKSLAAKININYKPANKLYRYKAAEQGVMLLSNNYLEK